MIILYHLKGKKQICLKTLRNIFRLKNLKSKKWIIALFFFIIESNFKCYARAEKHVDLSSLLIITGECDVSFFIFFLYIAGLSFLVIVCFIFLDKRQFIPKVVEKNAPDDWNTAIFYRSTKAVLCIDFRVCGAVL